MANQLEQDRMIEDYKAKAIEALGKEYFKTGVLFLTPILKATVITLAMLLFLKLL